jgi:diguanylate cyclase (GGDEF)-like protein
MAQVLIDQLDLSIVSRLAKASPSEQLDTPALARLLVTDSLTGLYNRAYFEERLRYEMTLVSAARPVAVFLIDLDRFKELNDQHGHKAGDRALQQIAQVLRAAAPAGAACCRLGGDEFVVLAPGLGSSEADRYKEQLAAQIAACEVEVEAGIKVRLAGSVGSAVALDEGTDQSAFLHGADAAMYQMKRRTAGARSSRNRKGAGETPFFGRAEALESAMELVSKVYSGQGQFLFISGPPGIGKSRLAQEITKRTGAQRMAVLQSRVPREMPMEAIRQGVLRLADLIGPAETERLRQRYTAVKTVLEIGQAEVIQGENPVSTDLLGVGVRLLLQRATVAQPLVWVLDDIRMADSTTIGILESLAFAAAGLPVLLIAAARTEGAWETEKQRLETWWQKLAPLPQCHRFELVPLDAAAAAQLAEWALGSLFPAEALMQQPEVTRGNPLFITCLAADWKPMTEAPAELWEMKSLLLAQLEAYSEPARSVLAAAAVLGYEMAQAALVRVVPETPTNVRRALDELVEGGWLLKEQDRIYFTHHMVQETVYGTTATTLRRSLHRSAALVLSGLAEHPPGDLARHFEEGGDWEQAMFHHARAGEAAERVYAVEEALRHYQRAIHLGEELGQHLPNVVEVAFQAGSIAYHRWDRPTAIDLLEFAVRQEPAPELTARCLYILARAYTSSRRDLCNTYLQQAIEIFRDRGPSIHLAEALFYAIYLLPNGKQSLSEARRIGVQIRAVADRLGDPVLQQRFEIGVAGYLAYKGDPEPARRFLDDWETRLSFMEQVADKSIRLNLLFYASMSAVWLGRFIAGRRFSQEAARLGREVGNHIILTQSLGHLATGYLAQGLVAEAESIWDDYQLELERYPMFRLRYLHYQTRVSLFRHDLPAAMRYDEELVRHVENQGYRESIHPFYVALARAKLGESVQSGETDDLAARLAQAPDPDAWGYYRSCLFAETLIALGAPGAAQPWVDGARSGCLNLIDLPWIEWLQGQIHLAQGRRNDAVASFQKALSYRGWAYYRASAHRDLARLLLARSDESDQKQARRHITAAQQLFDRMGNQHELEGLLALEAEQMC